MRPRNLFFCVLVGIGLGFLMIWTHIGPGLTPVVQTNTPAYRNAQRAMLLGEISSGLRQYYKDHGPLPVTLSNLDTQICRSYGDPCLAKHYVDLGFLTTAGDYISLLPQDPLGGDIYFGSGFYIAKLPDGTIRLKAGMAENGKAVETTFKL